MAKRMRVVPKDSNTASTSSSFSHLVHGRSPQLFRTSGLTISHSCDGIQAGSGSYKRMLCSRYVCSALFSQNRNLASIVRSSSSPAVASEFARAFLFLLVDVHFDDATILVNVLAYFPSFFLLGPTRL